jgi:peroxiredoxin (alkyl hydroperoxide reductase subunit C)
LPPRDSEHEIDYSFFTKTAGSLRFMIKLADTLPSLKLMAATPDGPREISTDEIFKGKKVVLFAVPGAFTPTCSAKHLPGFNDHVADLRAKGVDTIVCMAVNDAYVMGAWAKAQDVNPDIVMLADGSGQFTHALGLDLDLTQRGLGMRSQRFALVADDMKVTYLAVEKPGDFDVSRAEAVLAKL